MRDPSSSNVSNTLVKCSIPSVLVTVAGARGEQRHVDRGIASIVTTDLRQPDSYFAAFRAPAHRLPSNRTERLSGHG